MSEVPQCPGCGHNYFNGGSGLCQWCRAEEDIKCVRCGKTATCTGFIGKMCHSSECMRANTIAERIHYQEKASEERW